MKYISKQQYLDKMKGCWLGKSIGGTLGTPFEPTRGVYDIDFYTTDLKDGMLPNDDLDLQLVWLNAAEKYKTSVNAEILSDYWILGIIPNWAEYGVSKNNMRLGLLPPASGIYKNKYKDSNGAWIRSEIWACLAPGHPEVAVKYAYEDACTDHGNEGVYAEIFTAALESAAFTESDKFKLISIALSYIPEDCVCAKAVQKLIELYRSGVDWKTARKELMISYPGSFGNQHGDTEEGVTNAEWGFDAPNNIALTLIGWLYGGDDFGRSLCITTGCGEDADCTSATLGAILGIIHGESAIPEKWKKPIGNTIRTICINNFAHSLSIPKTIDELTRRTANLMPAFINGYVNILESDERFISAFDDRELYSKPKHVINSSNGWRDISFIDTLPTGISFRGSSPVFNVSINALDGIDAKSGSSLSFEVKIENTLGGNRIYGMPLWANIRWITPQGISVEGESSYTVFVNQYHCGLGENIHRVQFNFEFIENPITNVICEITATGYASKIYVPVTIVATKN